MTQDYQHDGWAEALEDGPVQSDHLEPPFSDAGEDTTQDESAGGELAVSVLEFKSQLRESVREGMTLKQDIYDDEGVLLLAAGSLITPHFLQLLRERGITKLTLRSPAERQADALPAAVYLPPDPPATPGFIPGRELYTPHSLKLDDCIDDELKNEAPLIPVKPWRRPRMSFASLQSETARGTETYGQTVTGVIEICDTFQAGKPVSVSRLRTIVAPFLDMAAMDFDLIPMILALQDAYDEYLFGHCVDVAMLSMALATQAGMNQDRVTAVGLGALIHDIGMLRVPLEIRQAARPLTPQEWYEVKRHPLHTLDMVSDMRGLPRASKLIAYQVHERGDGSGYPRGRLSAQIHQYAKIVAMADAYTAMTSPRPYRHALTPYEAAKIVLIDGSLDRFDRSLVRVFLDTIALFPIGSAVVVSNGMEGRVIRANPGLHTLPVIEELDVNGVPTGHVIDLSKEEDLRVVQTGDRVTAGVH